MRHEHGGLRKGSTDNGPTIAESFPQDAVDKFLNQNWEGLVGRLMRGLGVQRADADAAVSESMMSFLNAPFDPEYGQTLDDQMGLLVFICYRAAIRLPVGNAKLTSLDAAYLEIAGPEGDRPDHIFEGGEDTDRLAELWRGKIREALGERLYGAIRELGAEEGCARDHEFCAWATEFFFVRKARRRGRGTRRKELMVRLGRKLDLGSAATYQVVSRARKRWRLAISDYQAA